VPVHFVREVEFFFTTYKQLEGITIEPLGWASSDEGTAEVRGSVERFRSSLGNVRD
jgi:inorganic pyrophosphatase